MIPAILMNLGFAGSGTAVAEEPAAVTAPSRTGSGGGGVPTGTLNVIPPRPREIELNPEPATAEFFAIVLVDLTFPPAVATFSASVQMDSAFEVRTGAAVAQVYVKEPAFAIEGTYDSVTRQVMDLERKVREMEELRLLGLL